MRIGLFSDTYLPDVNGVAVSIHNLAVELEKSGHTVFVVTTHAGLFTSKREGNVLRLPGLELKKLYGYVMTQPFQILALSEIKEMELDIIHVHTEFGVGIYARMIAYLLHIPIIGTYHTTYEDYTHYVNPFGSTLIDNLAKKTVFRLSKLAGDTCLAIISPSEKTKEMLLKYQISKPITVIPTGIDLRRFNPAVTDQNEMTKIKTKYELNDRFVLLYVGRVAEEKSIDLVIKALPAMIEADAKIKLLIVGDGPQLSDYKRLVNELKIKDYVEFAGKIPTEKVASYYKCCDSFVSASLTETQGLTFIEALASGLVVFARDKEVVGDCVIKGKTGYFFTNEEELATRVNEFRSKDEKARQDMKALALKTAETYSSEHFCQRVLKVYKEVLRDYFDLYRIIEIEYVKNCIQLTLENKVDKIRILVSVKAYYDLGIRKHQVLTNELVDALRVEEKKTQAYYRCLNRLKFKDRTIKEIDDFLHREFDLSDKHIEEIIGDLCDQGFIDDRRYVSEYLARKSVLLMGDIKIIRNLKKLGISNELIKELLVEDSQYEEELAFEYASKIAPGIKDHSVKEKQQLIRQRLFAQGFGSDIIAVTIPKLNFNTDLMKELSSLRKVAEKARIRYSRKYQGYDLRNHMFRYLSLKGYQQEDIYVTLDNMEWEDYEN